MDSCENRMRSIRVGCRDVRTGRNVYRVKARTFGMVEMKTRSLTKPLYTKVSPLLIRLMEGRNCLIYQRHIPVCNEIKITNLITPSSVYRATRGS